jgi:small subunit ribosomal protein S6
VQLRDYEMVYILAPTLEEEQIPSAIEGVTAAVQNVKGETGEIKPWGRRRLAYPIAGFREGNYVEMHFKMEPAAATELDRNLRLNEAVIRYLLIVND